MNSLFIFKEVFLSIIFNQKVNIASHGFSFTKHPYTSEEIHLLGLF